ncbi:MAG TPA: dethiobiotin synthase [Solirubrobacterales bacterium]|nr:dethiobiotin synthase [Solirubrobacterales bacterium]
MTEQLGGRREAGEASVLGHVSKPADRGLRDATRHARPRGVFVTGTGTEVGKTVVAAAIARTEAAAGRRVAVFKPAVTGLEDPGETDHALLRRAAGSSQSDAEIAPYRYQPPVSPHLGAELAGEEIDPERLRAAVRAAAASVDFLVCEGVGGLLVPLASRVCRGMRDKPDTSYLVRDLASDLGYPLVVAASPGLGTISHTLLTLEAARSAGLEVAMVVLTPWPEEPSDIERSNRETIAGLGDVRVETLPPLDLSDPAGWPPLAP